MQSVDYALFKQGNPLNSTEAETPEGARRLPSYMTPTMAAQNRMFKTPTTPASRSFVNHFGGEKRYQRIKRT
jgi:hypothetical protein